MSNKTWKEKYTNRIDQLLQKAEKVKATHTPNPRNVIGFPTLNSDIFNEWRTNCKNMLINSVGQNSPYYKDFADKVKQGFNGHVNSGMGILRALKEDIEMDMLSDIKSLAIAEVFSDFLNMAQHFLDNQYKDPAAFLVGAVLEDGLRKLSDKKGVEIKESDDISALNSKLADKNAYNRLVQSQIQAWKKLRNSADHGKFDEYAKKDVEDFLSWTRNFLSNYL